MSLVKEIETYNRELSALSAANQGKFALVHGDKVVGVFGTYEDALQAGYERFSLKPFLVKQIHVVERLQSFTRDLAFK